MPETFEADCKTYQKSHGDFSLCLYQGNGKLYIVRDQAADSVVLAEVHGTDDLTVSAADFSANFLLVLLDELPLYSGTKATLAEHQAVLDAMQRVLYGSSAKVVQAIDN